MNDDITVRELELVNAILESLKENEEITLITTTEYEQDQCLSYFKEGMNEGYQEAVNTVIDVLNGRGFEIKIVEGISSR